MKILILHLSDMHFRDNRSYKTENIENIINALKQRIIGATGIIIAVSGDLTFSGYYPQSNQIESFFTALVVKIKNTYHFDNVPIMMVPGNHDINYKQGSYTAENLSEIEANHSYNSFLKKELSKEKNALRVCKNNGGLDDSGSLVSIQRISMGDVVIKFNLINTAPFSSYCEDKGFHYLPEQDIKKLCENGNEDFVFTIMHHPYHYFNWETEKKLEEQLILGTDVLLVGHEHFTKIRGLSDQNASVKIFAGGMLCNAGNWDSSEFYVGVLDTHKREYILYDYRWSFTDRIYIGTESETITINDSKVNCLGCRVNTAYKNDLFSDKKYEIAHNFMDYYVFPFIEEQPIKPNSQGHEYKTEEKFFERLSEKRKAIIVGQNGTGKTVTAKYIFNHFSEKIVSLFIDGNIIRDSNFNRIIKNTFEDTYSKSSGLYESFLQTDKENKSIVIDNMHLIPEELHKDLLSFLDEQFGYIILTMRSEIELDISERIRYRTLTDEYSHYRIHSFYLDRRRNLVQKIVNLLIPQDDTRNRMIDQICDSLTKHKNLYVWNAEFITQFTKYACDNIGVSMTNDGDTFSKVFEHNLTTLIKPFSKKMKVEKIYFVLGKIAYEIHVSPREHKKYPMLLEDVCSIIRKYNGDYDSDIDPNMFVDILLQANVWKKYNDGYVFTERNYLAYFIAREINQKIHVNADVTEFLKALDFACFGINADIILFVTYISDNPNIIKWIMDKADEYAGKWEEFSLSPVNIQYLSDVDQLKTLPASIDDREENEQIIIEREKELEKSRELFNQVDIYSYDENDIHLMDEMIRTLSLMVILSRSLPSFEHFLEAKEKRRCVRFIYSLPLRIFYLWAENIENNKFELISEIKEMIKLKYLDEWEYRKSNKNVTDSDALSLLRSESILLLLELMNCAMGNSTKEYTIRYIDDFEYNEKMTYGIEHLMSQDKRDSPDAFIEEVMTLYKSAKAYIEKLLIQNVTKHYILTSKKLNDQRKIQRLNAKIFDNNLDNVMLLTERAKNEKR